jgi:hypothetical protein
MRDHYLELLGEHLAVIEVRADHGLVDLEQPPHAFEAIGDLELLESQDELLDIEGFLS